MRAGCVATDWSSVHFLFLGCWLLVLATQTRFTVEREQVYILSPFKTGPEKFVLKTKSDTEHMFTEFIELPGRLLSRPLSCKIPGPQTDKESCPFPLTPNKSLKSVCSLLP